MDLATRDKFILLWKKYFNNSELPFAFYYTKEEGHAELVKPGSVPRCFIGALDSIRNERSLCFNVESIECPGGKINLGYSGEVRADYDYVMSTGIPGKVEGKHYKKSPQIIREAINAAPRFHAPSPLIVFKRWDLLDQIDESEVVVFYAQPDVLSGLYSVAHFDEIDINSITAPVSSGCAQIIQYPYMQSLTDHPMPVIGMFDVFPRRYVPENTLAFSIPMKKFETMIENMEESFLTTDSWKAIQKRLP